MSSSLIPERPLLISPSLAATIGLEEACMLSILGDMAAYLPLTASNGREWLDLDESWVSRAMPFWTDYDVQRISRNLKEARKPLLQADSILAEKRQQLAAQQRALTEAQKQETQLEQEAGARGMVLADNISGHRGVIINTGLARSLGVNENDWVDIATPKASVRARAVLRQGIRPDTLLLIGQFEHWATPLAKDFGVPSLNTLATMSMDLTDSTGSGADIVRVTIGPAGSLV